MLRHVFRRLCVILAFMVVLSVFWELKLTGITMAGEAFCGHSEHSHGPDCFSRTLICTTEPSEASVGSEPTETVPQPTETATVPVSDPAETTEPEGHVHTDACYETHQICQQEVHIHTAACYSDISADLETADIWSASLSGLTPGPSTGENILMIARSQLGVTESTRNFQVDEFGVRRGITRYGQWYGNPYGDWSAMFVFFCLEYAGVEDVPVNAGAEATLLAWQEAGLFAIPTEHSPLPGELLFLDEDGNGAADAIALVERMEDSVIFAIQGDCPESVPSGETDSPEPADAVAQIRYAMDDSAILGYGLVPFESGLITVPEGGIELMAPMRTIWLDGTNGGLMSLGGSPNQAYYAEQGTYFRLPDQWQSPDKYSYVLRGWYDVINSKYYEPGAQVQVTGNMVFYADWEAATYDVGQFNSQVTDTISTNDFVTVRMFDYGILFNVLSERANISYNNGTHTETWNLLTSGNNPYNGQPTLNYIFRDWDRGNEDISYPNGHNDRNNPTDAGQVYPGLYTDTIRDLLFDPNTETIGKEYLGTGDHLFQLCLDPSHEHYGYYYYNSERNAASYNQSDQRFYVYEYLECTRTSFNSGDEGKYSDFLPLNSPYANTNGKHLNTYNYAGVEGEYPGVTHYMYDCRYNDNNNSPGYVGTNFLFGMSVEVDFYLPNTPGTLLSDGYGNQDLYGQDMHFRFTGDDDVWIFVDGKMVLDLGGLHGRETGDINFSTGTVTINGAVHQQFSNTLKTISDGEHTLMLYYLERGSSMSNCAIYFNLAPRFSFTIEKEDVLTREVLNGAQFSVYTDPACTVPARLWTSKAAFDNGEPSTNVFTVVDGKAHMWGMGAGNVYYIKETKGPDDPDYSGVPNGVIRLVFNKTGSASYSVEILDQSSGISPGFTVHGFRINEETQQAYIVATNAPNWVNDPTSIQVRKQWADQLNHSADSVTVYLTVTDPDGTVRRLREATLSAENGWHHQWDNLPKYNKDGTPVRYGIEEGYISGYYSKSQQVATYSSLVEKSTVENGQTYLLRTSLGYLSTQNTGADTGFVWLTEDAAKNNPQALWTAYSGGQYFRLTNVIGQTITFYYNNGSSGYPTDFFASTGGETNESKQYLRANYTSQGMRLFYDGGDGRDYYLTANMTDARKFQYSTNSADGLLFTLLQAQTVTVTEGIAFLVTNTPLDQETSLTVQKHWDYGTLSPSDLHEKAQVTVKLLANGKDTGRTITLSLKNNWKDTFRGLPYVDAEGQVISYSVEEVWSSPDWVAYYGSVSVSGSGTPQYSTSITNRYRWGMGGPELPSTGSNARLMYVLCGGGIMTASLVYGILSRRKRERRRKSAF